MLGRGTWRVAGGVAWGLAALGVASSAAADRIATLRARAEAGTETDRIALDRGTEDAEHALGHTTASAGEVLQGEGAAGDLLGTSAGLVAVGKTTNSDWVVQAHILKPAGPNASPRIEVEACQVSTGRVETLARDVDLHGDLAAQLRPMLSLLLRPQGIGDDPLPWEQPGATSGSAKPPGEAAQAKPSRPRIYGENGTFGLGASFGVERILVRPDEAQGSKNAGSWSLVALMRIVRVDEGRGPSVELLARAGRLFGPPGDATRFAVGARVMLPLTWFLAAGAGGHLGLFQHDGARPLFGVGGALAFTAIPHLQIELDALSIEAAPAKEGTLVFLGGSLAAIARF